MALTKAQLIDLNANELIVDLDADTSITADTDDQIDIKIAGADDFRFTANTFTALSGSSIVVPASGLTIGSTAVTSTAAELNLLDGGASTGTTAVADADGIITNDGGTMRLTTAATFKTYFQQGISTAYDDLTAGDAAVNITTTSGNITIDAAANDSDIIFKGTDNSADITMLTLDGSAAGDATFNNQVIIGDGKLVLNSTAVTSTAAELNLLDGVSGLVQADLTKLAAVDSTAAELNIVDGGTSATSTTVADADRVVLNDNGTMVQVAVTDLAAYFDDEITAMPNLVTTAATTVGALDSGSITSGFGAIDNGTSNIRSATITAETAFVPDAANGASLGTSSLEFADLYLHDGAQILFGADQDVVLTHAADVGLTLKTATTSDDTKATLTLQTGDTDIAANDVLGQLHFQAPDEGAGTDAILVAAGIAAISEGDFSASNNATKLSFQTGASEAASEKMSLSSAGILTVADDIIIGDGKTIGSASDPDAITIASNGQLTLTQTLIGTALDISGDIDVDGTTNLDVVDIDGAVDMASTLQVDGAITTSDGMVITTADNTDTLSLVSTDTDANSGPKLNYYRNSSSPADADYIGTTIYTGRNDNTQDVNFVSINVQANDVSDGTEDGSYIINTIRAGALDQTFSITPTEVIINDDSKDVDFRVESTGNEYGIFMEGSSGNTFIGTSSSSIANVGTKIFGTEEATNKGGINVVTAGGNTPISLNRSTGDGDLMSFRSENTPEGTIAVSGNTVAYNTFTGTHWSRLADNSKPTILKGTVMESLDAMVDWYNLEFNDSDGNEVKVPYALADGQSNGDTVSDYVYGGSHGQGAGTFDATIVKEGDIKHVQTKISTTDEAKNVYGVFHAWDDENGVNDMMIAAVGTYVVRIKSGQTVAKGDLLQSNGDGTAKVLAGSTSITADVLSTVFAKVLSNTKVETYADGSFIVPCSFTNC